jgi:hypothetical protein
VRCDKVCDLPLAPSLLSHRCRATCRSSHLLSPNHSFLTQTFAHRSQSQLPEAWRPITVPPGPSPLVQAWPTWAAMGGLLIMATLSGGGIRGSIICGTLQPSSPAIQARARLSAHILNRTPPVPAATWDRCGAEPAAALAQTYGGSDLALIWVLVIWACAHGRAHLYALMHIRSLGPVHLCFETDGGCKSPTHSLTRAPRPSHLPEPRSKFGCAV